jgi:hypothetical protein
MPQPLEPQLHARLMECWSAAALDPLGVAIRTNKGPALFALLQRARDEANVPGLDHLSVSVSGDDPNLIFIYDREAARKIKDSTDASQE